MGTVPPTEQNFSGKRTMDDNASGSGMAVSDLEAMMEELGLREGDLQDVVVEDEEFLEEATRGWP